MSDARAPRILLVEDDRASQVLTRRALAAVDGRVELTVVGDGEAALEYLRGEGRFAGTDEPPPHLVLLDLNLPGMRGQEVLKSVRADPALRSFVVVALTTSSADEDIRSCYALGVNSYIVKSLRLDAFQDTLRTLCRYWIDTVALPPLHRP